MSIVKPLEWRKGYSDDRVSILQASNGWLYQVRTLYDETGLIQSIWLDWPTSSGTEFPSVDEAKAAAQTDFERRALSALDPAYLDRVKQLEEALRPFAALAVDIDGWRHEPGSTCAHRLAADDIRRAAALLNGGSNDPR